MPLDSKSLKTLRDKHKHVFAAGGEKKTKERHEKGLLTARERLTHLFQPDTFQEFGTRGGIIRHGAKMLFAYSSGTAPKITIVTRKSYGGSYLAMCSQELGADFGYAWPTAEIAVMGAEGAVNILYSKEIKEADDPKSKWAELVAQYRVEFASPYMAASRGYITDVIEPSQTRGIVALSLRKLLGKRELRPPKKQGNIPM